MNVKIEKKSVLINFLLNFCASIIPVITLQIIIYPFMSKNMSEDEYGLMLTFYSLLMMISNSSGTAVSDLKILYYKEYNDNKLSGDFIPIMKKYLVFSVVCMCFGSMYYFDDYGLIRIFFVISTAILVFIQAYMHIELVLMLKYKNILINAIFLMMGYLLGAVLFKITGYWEYTYLMAYFASDYYLWKKTSILKESCTKTANYKNMLKESMMLFLSSTIGNVTSYADKIVLFPLIGGANVAIYYTASFLGKAISLAVTPLNRLILGYLSNMERINNKTFCKILFVTSGIAFAGYVVCLLITKPVMMVLYPMWVEKVLMYTPVTTATAVLASMASMIQPFVLRYSPVKFQTFIQASSAIVYFFCALLLLNRFGLMGFCVGGAIGNLYKLVCMVVIYFTRQRKNIIYREEV